MVVHNLMYSLNPGNRPSASTILFKGKEREKDQFTSMVFQCVWTSLATERMRPLRCWHATGEHQLVSAVEDI